MAKRNTHLALKKSVLASIKYFRMLTFFKLQHHSDRPITYGTLAWYFTEQVLFFFFFVTKLSSSAGTAFFVVVLFLPKLWEQKRKNANTVRVKFAVFYLNLNNSLADPSWQIKAGNNKGVLHSIKARIPAPFTCETAWRLTKYFKVDNTMVLAAPMQANNA